MAIPDLQINAVLLTNQPTTVELRPAEAVYVQTAAGNWLANVRDLGALIIVTWGVDAAVQAIVAELETKRGSTYNHTVEWNDAAGAARGPFNVLIPPIPVRMRIEAEYDVLTLTMRQRS